VHSAWVPVWRGGALHWGATIATCRPSWHDDPAPPVVGQHAVLQTRACSACRGKGTTRATLRHWHTDPCTGIQPCWHKPHQQASRDCLLHAHFLRCHIAADFAACCLSPEHDLVTRGTFPQHKVQGPEDDVGRGSTRAFAVSFEQARTLCMWQPGALAMLAAWEVVGDQGGQFRFTILEGHLAVWTSWTNDVPVSASPRDGNGYRPQLMTRQRLDPSVWSESWTHVALVRDGLQLTAYVNGSVALDVNGSVALDVNGSVALDGRARTHFDHRTHVPLRMGCHPSGGGAFDGEIRSVVAGHVALTAAEVRSLAAALPA
jgi:hypothetical protein